MDEENFQTVLPVTKEMSLAVQQSSSVAPSNSCSWRNTLMKLSVYFLFKVNRVLVN